MEDKYFSIEKKQSSIVLVGAFNPAMFHPSWFVEHGIITKDEAELSISRNDGEQLIVTNQFTSIRLDELTIRVEQNKIQFIANNNILSILKTICLSTLKKLSAVTIKAFGFNFSAHYRMNSLSDYQLVGDKLAPKSYWKDFLGDEISGDNRKSGLAHLRMVKNKEHGDRLIFDFEPSNLFKQSLFMACNDHHEVISENNDSENVASLIEQLFDERINYIENLQTSLLTGIIND